MVLLQKWGVHGVLLLLHLLLPFCAHTTLLPCSAALCRCA